MAVHENSSEQKKKSSDALDEISTFNVENMQNNTRIINYRFARYLTVLPFNGIAIAQFRVYLTELLAVTLIASKVIHLIRVFLTM